MKNKFNKVVLSTLLITSSAMADYSFNVESLIGVEGGYSSLDVERSDDVENTNSLTKYKLPHAGLKIGAQTENYRGFLHVNYYSDDDFDYATTYGVSLQYLVNVSKYWNVFLGVNGGIMNLRYSAPHENKSRTLSDSYYGGDLGVNIHLGDSFDLELGGRYMAIDASNTIDDVTYTFDNMISGYGSIIYRFKMD